MKFSHTKIEKYKQCPKKYNLHYNKKLRTKYINSPLFFGKALDEAFNRMLLDKKLSLSSEEASQLEFTPEQVFDQNMLEGRSGWTSVGLKETEWASYSKSDINLSLLQENDIESIQKRADELGFEFIDIEDFVTYFQKKKERKDVEETKLYNYIGWHCLTRKGYILIEAYRQDIMPKILKVHTIQREVCLEDGDDEFIGFIDWEGEFVDEPGKVYIVDNKTSSRKYADDSVVTSEQLGYYCEYAANMNASYVVVEKKLRKRDPIWRTQIIKDEIQDEHLDDIFDNVGEIVCDIKEERFEGKSNNKDCWFFGKPCEYYGYCWHENLEGLEEKE